MAKHVIKRDGKKDLVIYGDFVDRYLENSKDHELVMNLYRSDEGAFIIEYQYTFEPMPSEDDSFILISLGSYEHCVERFDDPASLSDWIIEKEGELRPEIRIFFVELEKKDPDWRGLTETRLT